MDYQNIPTADLDAGRGDFPQANDDLAIQRGAGQPVVIDPFANDVFGPEGASLNSAGTRVTFTQPEQGTVTFDPTSGLFTFVPAPGQQGSARFTYTITDADGDSSSAMVVIDLVGGSPGGSVITAAAAGAAVQTADNVIVLPPGVTLDDVTVDGRNLVIQLPDGTVQVIPDGAVFVPEIVIDGVSVPPLNLAALLIGEETIGEGPIEPAAGNLRSSGGNFFDPAGPIQDAFGLGDLLPPTALAFPPQPADEVIPEPLDRDPVVTIVTADQPAGVSNATATVAESGLPARGNEPPGSNAAANTETTTGTIQFSSPDGITALTINGVAVTGAGQTFVSPRGTLTLTSVDLVAGTIGFSFTLTDNLVGGTIADQFTVALTDPDGDIATATLTVNVTDDAPTARADIDSVTEEGPLVANGNVVTGTGGTDANATDGVADTRGADGAAVTAVSFGATAGTLGAPLRSAFGSLTLNADGSYTYTLDNTNPRVQGLDGNDTLTEVFTYTLTDGDGDPSSTTLTVTINGSDDPITIDGLDGQGAEETVFENDLADGSSPLAANLTQTGTFQVNSVDGVATIAVGGLTVFANGAFTARTISNALGSLTITGVTTTTDAGGDVTAATVSYSYTLADNTLAHTGGNAASLTQSFAVAVTDSDGSTDTASLDIAVIDDAPIAANDGPVMVPEQTAVTIAALTNDTFGADGVSFASGVSFTQPTKGSVTYNSATGQFTYTPIAGEEGPDSFTYTITDGDGDSSTATVSLVLATDSVPQVVNVVAAVDDDGLAGGNPASTVADIDANVGDLDGAASSEASFRGQIAVNFGADTGTVSFANLDGTSGMVGTEMVTYSWNAATQVLTATGPRGALLSVALTPAGSYTVTLLDNVLHATAGDELSAPVVDLFYRATDSDGDVDTSGKLSITFNDDTPSASNVSAAQGAENQAFTIGIVGQFAGGADGVSLASGVTFTQAAQGVVSYNGNGTFTYTPNAGAGSTSTSDSFSYTVTDADGDSVTRTVNVTLQPDSSPVANDVAARLDDDGLAAGNPASTAGDDDQNAGEVGSGTSSEAVWTGTLGVSSGSIDAPLTYSLASAAGAGTVGTESVTYTYNATTNVLTATVAAGTRTGTVLFTVAITDTSTGAYTVTLLAPIAHATLNGLAGDDTENNTSASLTYTVSDSDPSADSDTGLITIDFDDDTPSASNVSATQGAENQAFTIGIVGQFAGGADGVSLASGVTFTQAAQGVVSYNGNGTFTYTPNAGAGSTSTSDSFSYTVTDADGDSVTRTINVTLQPDSSPVANDVAARLDDDGLAAGNPASTAGDDDQNAGEVGSGTSSEAVWTGTLGVSSGSIDAPLTYSLASAAGAGTVGTESVTYTYNATTNVLTATVAAGTRTGTVLFTVAITDTSTGAYTVTLLAPIAHATLNGLAGDDTENNTSASLTYTVSDSDPSADSDTGLITIDFDDDTPSASNVSATQGAENQAFTIGIVGQFAGGADGVSLATGVTFTQATQGVVSYNGNGTFTYTPNAGAGSTSTSDSFSYTVTDADGDSVTRTINVTLQPDSSPVANDVAARLDDDGLAAGNPASTAGDDDQNAGEVGSGTSSEAVWTGTLGVSSGSIDAPLTYSLASAAGAGTVGTESVTYSYNAGSATLTATVAAGTRTGTVLFTVAITDTSTGAYTVTLLAPIAHATLNGLAGDDTENNTSASLTYTVSDSDPSADSDTGLITIDFDDDTPSASNVSATQGAENQAFTIGIVGQFAGGADGVSLATGVTFTQATQGVVSYNGNGTFTYTPNAGAGSTSTSDSFSYTVTDADGDSVTRTVNVTLQPDSSPVANDVAARLDDDGLAAGNPASTAGDDDQNAGEVGSGTSSEAVWTGTLGVSSGSIDAPLTYSLASAAGAGTVGTESVTYSYNAGSATLTATVAAGTRTGTVLFTVAITDTSTGAYTVTLLAPIAHATLNGLAGDDTENNTSASLTYTVSDGDPSADSDTGLITIDFDDDTPSASNVSATQGAENQAFTIGIVGQFAGGADGVSLASGVTFTQAAQGVVSYNGNGTFTYTPNAGAGSTSTSDSFSYTVTDADGDSVTRTINVTLQPDSSPVANDVAARLDDDGLAAGNPASTAGDDDQNAGEVGSGTSSEAVWTGTLGVSSGSIDAPLTYSLASAAGAGTVGTESVTYSYNAGSATLTATVAAGTRTGTVLFTVAITDVNTGAYTVTLLAPIAHATLNGLAGDDTENNTSASLTYTVSDSDPSADSDTGLITIDFDDDTPSASNVSATQGAENQAFTISIVGQFAGGADGVSLASGVTFTQATQGVVSYNGNGTFTYTPNAGAGSTSTSDSFSYTVTDADGDSVTRTVNVTLQPDSSPVANDVAARLDDDGLAAGNPASTAGDDDQNAGEVGSGTSSEAVWTGTLGVSSGSIDAPLTYSLASAAGAGTVGTESVTYTYNATTNVLTATVAAGTRTGTVLFTVAITDVNTGAYTVTLLAPIAHATLNGLAGDDTENNTSASLTYTVSDSDPSADSDTGLITIDFDDDTPSASNVSATQGAENQAFTISIVGQFAGGADGVSLATGVTFTQATQGVVSYNGNGTFTYTPNAGAGSTSTSDSFSYTVTDADGDSVTRTINVTLQPDSSPVANDVAARLDDDGLAAGNPASTAGDDDQNAGEVGSGTSSEAVWTGTLGVSSGSIDAPLTYSLASAAGAGTVGTESVTYTYNATTNVLTATVAAGTRTGTVLFTVAITDTSTGAYTVTLLAPIAHATLNGLAGDDTENNTSASLTYTVSDSDPSADSDTGLITIDFDDDTPSASNVSATQGAENQAFTISIVGQFAGGADGVSLATGVTFTQATQGVVSYNGNGTFTYTPNAGAGSTSTSDSFSYTVTDADGDSVTRTINVTLQPDSSPVANDVAARLDDDGLAAGNPASTAGDDDQNAGEVGSGTSSEAVWTGTLGVSSGSIDAPLTYSLASAAGAGTVGTESVTYTWNATTNVLTATVAAGTRTGTVLFTVAITDVNTGAYTVTLLAPIAHATLNGLAGDDTENNTSASLTYTVSDSDPSADSDTGLITIDFDDDTPSASNVSATQGAENQAFTISIVGQFAGGADGVSLASGVTFTQATQGVVSYNGNGTFTYTPNAGAGSTSTSDSFSYTVTDADGDSVTRTINVTLQPDSVPQVVNVVAAVDDDGLAGGNPGSTAGDIDANVGDLDGAGSSEASFSGQINVTFGADTGTVSFANLDGTTGTVGTETVAYTWDAGTNVLTATGPRGALFTVSLTPSGAYTVTLLDNVLHAAGGNDEASAPVVDLFYRAADNDTNPDVVTTGKLSITFNDDAPTAISPAAVALNNMSGSSNTANLDIDSIANNVGADGGTVRFSPSLAGPSALTSNGQTINYAISGDGMTLTASTAMAGTIFTVVLNPFASPTPTYTVTMSGRVNSATNVNFNDGTYDFLGGNDPWAGFTPLGQNPNRPGGVPLNDNSLDLLLTPTGATGSAINGNANAAGVTGGGAGQNIGTGEGIRLDFVEDLAGNPAAGAGGANYQGNPAQQDHTFDNHYLVSSATVQFGDGQTNTTITLKAILAIDNATDTVLNNGTLVSVSQVAIRYDGEVEVVTYDPLMTTKVVTVGAAGELADRTYTVEFVTDAGSGKIFAQVTGILDNAVSIGTFGETLYNALDIRYISGDDFDLTGFGTAAQSNAPVSFTLPVEVIDGDGDVSAASNLAITLNGTTPPVVLDLDGDGAEFVARDAGVTFDYAGDGNPLATAWASSDDGVLGIDLDGDGRITRGAEIVFGGDGLTDLQGLAAKYDSNHDGVLDAQDAAFAQFGVLQGGQFTTLTAAGIASIGLSSDGVSYTAANGDVTVSGTGGFTRADGSLGSLADASFATAVIERHAQTTGLTATSAAAGGIVAAAAAAAVTSLPAAASEAPAVAVAETAPAASMQSLPGGSTSLEAVGAVDGGAVAQVRAGSASHGSGDAETDAGQLATLDDAAGAATPLAALSESFAPAASLFAGHAAAIGGGQLMDALLIAGSDGNSASQTAQDLAAVQEAFGDTHAAQVVDTLVDHFAAAGDGAGVAANPLAALFGGGAGASDGFVFHYDANQVVADMSALAAAHA